MKKESLIASKLKKRPKGYEQLKKSLAKPPQTPSAVATSRG